MSDYEHHKALRTVCGAIFGRNNLIASDFADIEVEEVENRFPHEGIFAHKLPAQRITFTISADAIGKVSDEEFGDALYTLLAKPKEGTPDASSA